MNLEQQRLGDYVLAERLGEDKTGTLYRAVHATSQSEVAVRVLHERYGKGPAIAARLRQELRAAGNVDHPGLAKVIDHGESEHGLFVVMESLVGESLADRCKRQERLSLQETQEIVGMVASALAAAHRARMVHRTLTADSVFLVRDKGSTAVKVLGLGLARIVGSHGSASGKEIDQRTDIHAVGRLAYEMLSGQVPIAPHQPGAKPNGPRPKPASLASHGVSVPAAIEAAIMKALEGKKKRRFSSMAEFAEAFGVVLNLPGTPAPPPPPAARAAQPLLAPIAPTRSASAKRKGPPPIPASERLTTLAGVVAPLRELGRKATRRQWATVIGGVSAAAVLIIWLGVRSSGPSDPVVADINPPPASPKTDPKVQQPPDRRPPPGSPSRVDDILALNQKAVSAYARSDIKAARDLLEQADKLAVESGYENAMVRAQTQVRLGALWMGGKKNPRIGRRYFSMAVAINPAVRLPEAMTTPRVRKALNQVRSRAHAAEAPAKKRTLDKKSKRRHGREGKRPR